MLPGLFAIAAFLVMSLVGVRLHAQVGAADVLGTVTDPSGAVIVGAKVTVKNLGTSVERTTTTNAKGEYVVNLLPIGSYGLIIEAPGFNTHKINGFSLSTGDRARLDVKLVTGAVTEHVEVTADNAILQTDSSTVSSTIETSSVQDLPLPNRNYFAVVNTMAGLNVGYQGGTTTKGSATSGNSNADYRPASTVIANGQGGGSNNNLINGFDNNEVANGIAGARPTADGIAEVHVESTNAPAEYGRAAGAVVNVVTKSGTNSFHGSGFEYLRNEATNARNYYSKAIDTDGNAVHVPLYRQNNFGGSLGGPVRIPRLYNGKDKTFFFFGYERDPNKQGLTYTTKVPTKYELANPGDFTDVPDASSTDILASDQINALSLKMFNLYPEPNAGEKNGIGYYTASPAKTQTLSDLEGRIDHHFSGTDTLFARYANNPANTYFPGAMPQKGDASPVGNAGVAYPGTSVTDTQNMQIDYVHIFRANLLLDLKAGYSRYNSHAQGLNYGKGLAAEFGVPNAMAPGTVGDDLPMYGGGSFAWSGIGGGATYRDVSNSYQYGGSLIYSRGSHDLKFGGGVIDRQLSFAGNASAVGRVIVGVDVAPYFNQRMDFLAGYPLIFFRNSPVYSTFVTGKEWSAYAQDNWRVTPQLTVNMGVRYDIFTAYKERFNHVSNFNANTLRDGLTLDAHNFIEGGTGGVDTNYKTVVPRLGIAYSFNAKTVIRTGFGMSYGPAGSGASTSSNAPYYFNYSAFMPNLNDSTVWKNPVMSSLADWNSDSSVSTVSATAANPPATRVFQTNFAVQHEFGANTLTAAFVGVFGRDMATSIDLNKPNMPGAGNATAPYVYTLQAASSSISQSYYATMNNVTSISANTYNGYSNYTAMQLIYSRHVGKDLTINSNWTWAHSLATVNGMGSVANGAGAANDDELAYGNSDNDIRHRITASASYTLPFGKHSSGITGLLLKGWQANTVFQWQTGTPYTVISSAPCYSKQPTSTSTFALDSRCGVAEGLSYTNQQGQAYYAPDIVGKPIVNGKLNLSAFAPPVPGTNGNEGVNPLYGPHFRNDDLSLLKTFAIKDNVSVQFRAECFNISNTPNFAALSPITTGASISAWAQGTVTGSNPTGLVAADDSAIGVTTDTSGFSTPRNFQFALKLLF